MTSAAERELEKFLQGLRKRNPHETEFHQAVEEVASSVIPYALEHTEYQRAQILERLTEPDRVVIFRVSWEDDDGNVRANRAWRVQFNNAIGPYKGGLRFHPSVTQSVLKFLGFEQIFKNSLTGLPMGGAKGGSNFNPKGKSDREVMRFCQSLMSELHRYIGEDKDVPAGDIGVGAREVGYLFGQYARLEDRWAPTMTGKGMSYGGSEIRTEATGYGCIYFLREMLEHRGDTLAGKRVAISGAGNVAIYAAEKVVHLGGKVVTMSDSGGFVHDPAGIDADKLEFIRQLKEERRGRISEYAEAHRGVEFHAKARPWGVDCDVAVPCATQNELDGDEARTLLANGVVAVSEGANMPCTADAQHAFREKGVAYAPGKAANAGGVAVSGLEQSQNAMRLSWSSEEVDSKLQDIMKSIHSKCAEYGKRADGKIDYVDGANIGGFKKVADAMLAYGIV